VKIFCTCKILFAILIEGRYPESLSAGDELAQKPGFAAEGVNLMYMSRLQEFTITFSHRFISPKPASRRNYSSNPHTYWV